MTDIIERLRAAAHMREIHHEIPDSLLLQQAADELAEHEATLARMSDLLSRVAIALRVPEPALTRWNWHDLPELAAAAIAAPQPPRAEVEALERRAFAQGWRCAAEWAQRDDLIADIGSDAYERDMADALLARREGNAEAHATRSRSEAEAERSRAAPGWAEPSEVKHHPSCGTTYMEDCECETLPQSTEK